LNINPKVVKVPEPGGFSYPWGLAQEVAINRLILTTMTKVHGFFTFLVLALLSACSTKVSTSIYSSYPILDYKQEVLVIPLDQSAPDKVEVLGQVKINDSGFSTKCGYKYVINRAKLEARKVGGNAIKIVGHKLPSPMGSACHRITANILKIDDDVPYQQPEAVFDSAMRRAGYAILHIYRNTNLGVLLNYDLHLGDTVICRVKNGWSKTIRVEKDGYNKLWARTVSKSEIPIKIEYGREYYVRCGVTWGVFVGNPSLELVDNKTGKAEYDELNPGSSNNKDFLFLKDGRKIECEILKENDQYVYFVINDHGKRIHAQVNTDEVRSIKKAE
jgi:hypothetical protein